MVHQSASSGHEELREPLQDLPGVERLGELGAGVREEANRVLRAPSIADFAPQLLEEEAVLERRGDLRRQQLEHAEPAAGEGVGHQVVLEVERRHEPAQALHRQRQDRLHRPRRDVRIRGDPRVVDRLVDDERLARDRACSIACRRAERVSESAVRSRATALARARRAHEGLAVLLEDDDDAVGARRLRADLDEPLEQRSSTTSVAIVSADLSRLRMSRSLSRIAPTGQATRSVPSPGTPLRGRAPSRRRPSARTARAPFEGRGRRSGSGRARARGDRPARSPRPRRG